MGRRPGPSEFAANDVSAVFE